MSSKQERLHLGIVAKAVVVATVALSLAGCLLDESDDSSPAQGVISRDPGSSSASGNAAPVLSGNPQSSVKVGEGYEFRPAASDADGDSLTFSVTNKPRWADFDTTTGQLSGTPQQGDEATYDNIRITVTDGSASDSLSFSITVTQVATGSVTLSWTAPTENTDGTPLTDLAGYKIYYGTESRSYTTTIDINNPGVTSYVVENLSPSTYYFAATSFNSDGVESDFSGEATRTVNAD